MVDRDVFRRFSKLQLEDTDLDIAKYSIVDDDEFFDERFDFDFTRMRDTETYYRGEEEYERPCGWYRYGLRVLDKYNGNSWLGRYHGTGSVPGEWPVSYHGTSREGARGIIEGYYKPGPGQHYGRGIYSTPYISVASKYAKAFTLRSGKSYKVILQNRINPRYRQIHKKGHFWLVPIPDGLSARKERKMVERAIRPYSLLLKEV